MEKNILDIDQNLATQLVAMCSGDTSYQSIVVEMYHFQDNNSKHLGCTKGHSKSFIFVFSLYNNPTM